ncbi:c-type cytochrome [Bacillus horti]|uniref:Mono/diheme cytochrome c family protein n=1 Tax=Caldalkalibacillus horti TaxID=77523 RepID=A0ABT9W492_9BACI|nr:cytochrome c [Bacillus horti]MDQ0168066.1 mono/diheme cytochrome c family protein [Bacillus horti]
MSPIRVFLSIFAVGILLTVVLGVVGLNTDTDLAEGENGGTDTESANVPQFMNSCINCHGTDLSGQGTAPGLLDLSHLSEEEIMDILVNGQGAMPGGMAAGNEDEVIEYLLSIQE